MATTLYATNTTPSVRSPIIDTLPSASSWHEGHVGTDCISTQTLYHCVAGPMFDALTNDARATAMTPFHMCERNMDSKGYCLQVPRCARRCEWRWTSNLCGKSGSKDVSFSFVSQPVYRNVCDLICWKYEMTLIFSRFTAPILPVDFLPLVPESDGT